MDDFEQRLRRQPLNTPPADWRDAILTEARQQSRTGFQPVATDEPQRSRDETPVRTNATNENQRAPATRELASPKPAQSRAATTLADARGDRQDARPTLLAILRGWLWPHPGAWAGLTAIWLLLFVVQHQMNVEIRREIELAGTRPPVRDVMLAFEEQQAMINQFLAANTLELPALDRPRRPARTQSLHPLMLITS